jgi:hypothetical protein
MARVHIFCSPVTALSLRLTWNQRGYCNPILATVLSYGILQLDVLVFFPFARTSLVDVGFQSIMSSAMTLSSRSTWNSTASLSLTLGFKASPSLCTLSSRSTGNQRCNSGPITAITTVFLYRIPQFDVFDFYPCTRTSNRLADARSQGTVPSEIALSSRSTRNQRRDCGPIRITVLSYRVP